MPFVELEKNTDAQVHVRPASEAPAVRRGRGLVWASGAGPRGSSFSFLGLQELGFQVQGVLAAQVATPGGNLGTCSGG